LAGCFLKNHDIHYDCRKNFITIHKVNLKEGFRFPNKPDIIVSI